MFTESTKYETRIIQERLASNEPVIGAVMRYFILSDNGLGQVIVRCETNDDNDDGYPDGSWQTWDEGPYRSVEHALKSCGVCRVGVSGVIVTVTLDGEEVKS